MRPILIFILLLFLKSPAIAQKSADNSRYPMVDTKPRFNGDLNKYIFNNLHLPEENKKTGGSVLAEFLIDTLGGISNIYIVRKNPRAALTPLETEVMRVIKNMPPWIPGKLKGRKVAVKYSLPVNIR